MRVNELNSCSLTKTPAEVCWAQLCSISSLKDAGRVKTSYLALLGIPRLHVLPTGCSVEICKLDDSTHRLRARGERHAATESRCSSDISGCQASTGSFLISLEKCVVCLLLAWLFLTDKSQAPAFLCLWRRTKQKRSTRRSLDCGRSPMMLLLQK